MATELLARADPVVGHVHTEQLGLRDGGEVGDLVAGEVDVLCLNTETVTKNLFTCKYCIDIELSLKKRIVSILFFEAWRLVR